MTPTLTLSLAGPVWRMLIRHLAEDPGCSIIGALGRQSATPAGGSRLLVRNARPVLSRLAGAATRALAASFEAVRMVKFSSRANELLQREAADAGAIRLVLGLGLGPERGAVQALASWKGTLWGVERVEVIGGPWIELGATRSPTLAPAERERWSRTIGALSEPIWQRLHDCQVAVVGLGRSGSLAAHLLALQGTCGRLCLIDPDRLERANLAVRK